MVTLLSAAFAYAAGVLVGTYNPAFSRSAPRWFRMYALCREHGWRRVDSARFAFYFLRIVRRMSANAATGAARVEA